MEKYAIVVFCSEEEEGFIAAVPDLKDCSAFGQTGLEALKDLEVAMRLWFETVREQDKPFPEPKFQVEFLGAA